MAALLTVLSIIIGIAIGATNGGTLERALLWRPAAWQLLAAGIALQLLLRTGWLGGGWASLVEVISSVCLMVFAAANIRIGGMVLVLGGLVMNFIPMLVNWGTPTSLSALRSAGVVTGSGAANVTVSGARHVATDNDWFRVLGEVIPMPTHQVISLGDLVLLCGYALVIASVMRGRTVRRTAGGTYRERIAPLAKGPANRRGPGLHPSRLGPSIKHPAHTDRRR